MRVLSFSISVPVVGNDRLTVAFSLNSRGRPTEPNDLTGVFYNHRNPRRLLEWVTNFPES